MIEFMNLNEDYLSQGKFLRTRVKYYPKIDRKINLYGSEAIIDE